MSGLQVDNAMELSLTELEGIFYLTSERIGPSRLYCNYFRKIPSIIIMKGLSFLKCLEYLEANYSEQILNRHEVRLLEKNSKKYIYDYIFIIFKDNTFIYMDRTEKDEGRIDILFQQERVQLAEKISKELIQLKLRINKQNHIHLVIPGKNGGLDKSPIKINKPKIKIETHYNDDLILLHLNSLKKLKAKNESDLFLFHGQPGTGKSTYIRYLIHLIKKRVIFISPNLAGNLDSPTFTAFLINNPNSIFVIEDAENLIVSRDSENNSAISMILNLTDGLLGEGLGIQFICTFNTHLSRIDKALLRKGRLKALYEFDELSVDKSNYLLESLSLDYVTNKPMTLAEIYNLKEDNFDFDGDRRVVGFAA